MDRTRKRMDGLTEGRTVRLLYASQSSFGGIITIACTLRLFSKHVSLSLKVLAKCNRMSSAPLYRRANQLLLILCILMDFSIYIDTISMGLPIVYLKGSQVEISKL